MTKVARPAPDFSIDYRSRILLIGSCFAESIAAKLDYYRFDVEVNPCGILYNPLAAAHAIERLVDGRATSEEELLQVNGKWVSLHHHGSFSDPDPRACLEKINGRAARAAAFLRQADLLVITWGTSWVYRHRATGVAVANCHKIPDREFERFRLSVDEIVDRYARLIPALRALNPRLRLLFTVSPVRHLRDDARGNQLSKATLLLAVEQLQARFEDTCYFPAYEILLDELRDYRFYAADMCHPSPIAVDYIWEIFKTAYLSPACAPMLKQVEALRDRMNHRPLDPRAAIDYQQLEQQLNDLVSRFKGR